jgi:hypothetical protein
LLSSRSLGARVGRGGGSQPGVAVKAAVEQCRARVQKVLGSVPRPPHLLLLAHALVDHMVDGRLNMGRRDALPLTASDVVVGEGSLVAYK